MNTQTVNKTKLTKVTLDNRAWRGLRAYTPEIKYKDFDYVVLEISGHHKGGVMVQEYNHKGRDCFGQYVFQGKTFKEALEFIKDTYHIECVIPEYEKDITPSWTWEQNIIYAESGGKNDKEISKMVIGKNVSVKEIEILEYLKDNPCMDYKLEEKFPNDFKLIDRLKHNYGNGKSPQVKYIGEWSLTDQGLKTLDEYYKDIKSLGYCERSLY